MAEGDVYIMNDPYDGGSHLPDIVIVVPIRYQGRTVALIHAAANFASFFVFRGLSINESTFWRMDW
jgi:hypothetical protein